jgi:hypothetical protein
MRIAAMVMAWYIRSSVCPAGENVLEFEGREVDAEWEVGCMADLPFVSRSKSIAGRFLNH